MLFPGFPQDCLSIRAVDGAQQSEALRVFVVARQTEKADPCPARRFRDRRAIKK